MAGTLTISTLSDGTNSTSATNPIRGSAKAWASTTTTGLVRGYNVSSVTYSSLVWTFNFTNAMTNTTYTVTSASSPTSSGGDIYNRFISVSATNTTSVVFQSTGGGTATNLYMAIYD